MSGTATGTASRVTAWISIAHSETLDGLFKNGPTHGISRSSNAQQRGNLYGRGGNSGFNIALMRGRGKPTCVVPWHT
jgi:hypothetical protein